MELFESSCHKCNFSIKQFFSAGMPIPIGTHIKPLSYLLNCLYGSKRTAIAPRDAESASLDYNLSACEDLAGEQPLSSGEVLSIPLSDALPFLTQNLTPFTQEYH